MKADLGELAKTTRTIFLIGFSVLLSIVSEFVPSRWLPTRKNN